MPGVQCVICLSSDTSSDEWCMLRECGHVFHVHCVVQSLEHARRCPQCRQEYSRRKYTTANPPYQRIFFEFSDEPASQPMPSGGGGEGTAGGSFGGGNGSGTAADVQQISFLQGQLRDKDRRIQAISTQLAEQEERAQQLELDLGQARAGVREREAKVQEKILELSREHKQVKGLANQIANLTAQLKAESARSSLMALATDQGLAGHALAAEVDKLVRLGLKAPHDFWEKLMSERSQTIMANSNRHSREKKALEQRQQQLQAELSQLQEQVATLKRSLSAARQQQAGLPAAAAAHDTQLDVRQHGSTTASRRPGRRFGGSEGQPAGAAATAAAGEEDPLVHTYGLLNMRQTELAAATASQHDRSRQQQQQQQQAPQREVAAALEAKEEEEEEVVLLDGSEEQVDLSDGGCFSEVESESESEGEEQRQQTAASQQQQGTRAPFMQQQPQQQQPQQQQQQQQTASGSMLGKRPFLGSSQCSAFSMPDENSRSMPLLATAGPGRVASQQAPGHSFIRNAATASVGIERGKYISSGPDGKGGVATAYQGSGSGASVRLLAQKQINAMRHVGSKKARSRPASNSSSETTAAQALRRNNALPITSFFNRSQQ